MQLKRKHPPIVLTGVFILVNLFSMISIAPAQNETWITKAEMPTARWGASACIVGGEIYVLGGAGKSKNRPFVTIEVYNPRTDAWTSKADMPIPNYFFSTSVVNGKIYIIGGAEWEWGFKASVVEYDPASETWTSKTDMPTARSAHAARVVDGVIYVIGGSQGSTVLGLQTVEAYDPATDVWTQKTKMPTGRSWLATSVVDGIIYAIGGTAAHFVALSAVEAYDPAADVWTSKMNMPTPRVFPAAEAVQGKIYAIGGTKSRTLATLNTIEAYDPGTDIWTKKAAMPTIRTAISCIAMDGKIYIMGGTSHIVSLDSIFATVEEYTPPVVTSVEDPSGGTNHPNEFVLHQNYPNPFNPATAIRYQLSAVSDVELAIYNHLGQKIRTLVHARQSGGYYTVSWDGRDNSGRRVASGVYLYQLKGEGLVQTRKMVLLQ